MRQRRQIFGTSLIVTLSVMTLSVSAASNVAGVTQSYSAGSAVQAGMMAELQPGNPQAVIPLTGANPKLMLGVVVPASNAAIVLSPTNPSQQQVLVATAGRYDILVTNQNGPIKSGDYVTLSSLDGIGMKADSNQAEVIGQAVGNFNGSSGALGTAKLKDQTGRGTNVAIASIPVNLDIMPNPLYHSGPALVPGFLDKFANGLAGKQVSSARVYLALILLLATSFIVFSVLYGSLRGSLVALGRNPLSKQSIMRGLLQSLIAVLVIFTVGIFAVYLLLKL